MLVTNKIFRAVRTAAWKKAANDRGKVVPLLKDFDLITEELDKFYWKDNWRRKILTCLQNIQHNLASEAHNETYYTFVLLCKYLGYSIEPKVSDIDGRTFYEYDIDHRQLVSLLFNNVKLVTAEMKNEQVNEWRKSVAGDPIQHFNFYCAQPNGQIGKGRLTLDFTTKKPSLKIGTDIHALSGNIIDERGNLFILFDKDPKTKLHSYLSLVADNGKGAADADTLYGHFSYCAVGGSNMPVAVKAVATRNERKNAEHVQIPEPSAQTTLELTSQTIGNNLKFSAEDLKTMKGHYDGYWFGVGNYFNYIKFYLRIDDDGRCLISSPKGDLHGIVVNYKPNQVFECKFSRTTDFLDPFLTIIIDLDSPGKNYYDGIFSRQRENESVLNAGKLRIYKVEATVTPRKYVRDIDELPEGKKVELDNYFLGRPAGSRSSRFIQPTEDTFIKYFNPVPIDYKDAEVKRFNGSYTLYRLDSKRENINRYAIHIEDGILSYTLTVKGKVKIYSGYASFDADCLKLNVFKRDSDDYNALYIFRIGIHMSSESEEYNGIYATINSDGAPVSGRVILEQGVNELSNKPAELFSNEYYALSPYIRTMLTGPEQNLIKISTKREKFQRKHNYGLIFYYTSINISFSHKYRLLALKWALEHGFNQIYLIEKYLADYELIDREAPFVKNIDVKRDKWQNELCTVTITDDDGKERVFQVRES